MENKKAATESNLNDQALPQTATNSPVMHKQSLQKALKRVKNVVPGSPSKKKIVVKKLAESMWIIAKTTNACNNSSSHDIVVQVQTFYRWEEIARFMHGKQDIVAICDENGKWKEQKQILTMTVAEVYQFKNEYPDVTIGKSKFSSLHPMEVKLSSAVSRNVCNYIYHSNVNLILETLHSDISNIFPLHSDQLVKEHEIKNETCMSSNCDLCK